MKKLLLLNIILIFLCMTSLVYAKSSVRASANSVANAIGYTMSHEDDNQINLIKVETESIKGQLQNILLDKGFKLKSVFLYNAIKDKNQLHVAGTIMHTDNVNRLIQTEFDAFCSIKNKSLIVIDDAKLKVITRPRVVSFLVPANAIDLKTFKGISFAKAMQQTRSVAKRIDNFNIAMDTEPQPYTFVSFMMNRINKSDKMVSVLSDLPYSAQGKKGQSIKTKDGWLVAYAQTKFAYNNFQPKFFNILWETDNKLIPVDSYSTHGLVKEIQVALASKDYNVGDMDGRLNTETEASIQKYIKTHKFHSSTKISTALLWFMQQDTNFDIPIIVQATLLNQGAKIGAIDGKIGPKTIKALKRYQKALGATPDGIITPNMVYLLLHTSNNIDTFRAMNSALEKPILLKTYQEKKWPNLI